MSYHKKDKLLLVKEAKRLLKKDALGDAYGKFVVLGGICGYINQAGKNLQLTDAKIYYTLRGDLLKYKPSGKRAGEYWWPTDLKHVPVRQEVLDKLIEQYSTTTAPWYKRLFNYFKK